MDYAQNNKFKNVLAFCILMGNEKILTKSPDYIMEKFDRYIGTGRPDQWNWGLDADNHRLLDIYVATWLGRKSDGEQNKK